MFIQLYSEHLQSNPGARVTTAGANRLIPRGIRLADAPQGSMIGCKTVGRALQ